MEELGKKVVDIEGKSWPGYAWILNFSVLSFCLTGLLPSFVAKITQNIGF